MRPFARSDYKDASLFKLCKGGNEDRRGVRDSNNNVSGSVDRGLYGVKKNFGLRVLE